MSIATNFAAIITGEDPLRILADMENGLSVSAKENMAVLIGSRPLKQLSL